MALDLSQQALEAREQGLAEVYKLLQQPEDLERLPDLIHEYESKVKASKAGLSGLVHSQIEAVRLGLDLLDKSYRHVLKLRSCLDGIFKLCEECASLIDHRERIQQLSYTHSNVQKVLTEIKDIIDLPDHAELALGMLQDPSQLVSAYQALTVLEGTAENAKLAWKRNTKAAKHDMSSMMRYLERVSEAAAEFEALLFDYLSDYEVLAQEQPTLLVDCLRVVEMQERLDKQITRTKMEGFKPKRWRQRLMDGITRSVQAKFKAMDEAAPTCGEPNKTLRYNQEGDEVAEEERDYLGNLTSITLVDKLTARKEVVTDLAKLRTIEIIEEDIFDEDPFLEAVVPDLYAVEADLADVYDHVTPCFPPSYNIFETMFQMYHVQVAMVIDTIGQRAEHMSSRGSLRIMEFVRKYMDSLRGFGIDEALVRLPVSPLTNPDLPPGLDMLMNSYIERMETSVTKWYNNIMIVDLEYEPKPGPNGKLRTPGATDFFRILNEEIEVIRAMDDHGEVMFQTARMALRIMQSFQKEQTRVITDTDCVLSLELFCALLNNNVECYEQSLTFVEEVQEQLDEPYQNKLEVEPVCRGFLEVAKDASKRVVGVIFNDPGMSTQLKNLFSHSEWLAGRTTGVLVATLNDYMGDIQKYVETSFIKRVAESLLEELVRRMINIFIAGIPEVTDAMCKRMQADEDAFMSYFSQYLRPDKMAQPMQQLSDIRLLVASETVSTVVAAYESALSVHSGFTIDVLQKILDSRGTYGGWDKKQAKDAINGAKEIWKKRMDIIEKEAKKNEPKGFFSFWS